MWVKPRMGRNGSEQTAKRFAEIITFQQSRRGAMV